MMRGVVTEGTGRRLADLDGGPVIAKTGTAEYGTDDKIKTHAWMIAAQDDLAVAVFVQRRQVRLGHRRPVAEASWTAPSDPPEQGRCHPGGWGAR